MDNAAAVANNPGVLLIPVLPLLAALAAFVWGRRGNTAAYIGIGGLLASAALQAALLLGGNLPVQFLQPWIQMVSALGLQVQAELPITQVPLAFTADLPQLLFGLSTALIAVLCLVFSLRDRVADPARGRFYALLTLFAGAMLLLIAADTLLIVFVAWELMGLCSFLLIGHSGTPAARRAAREAFWTTRVTDFGLLFSIFVLMGQFEITLVSQLRDPAVLTMISRVEYQPWVLAAALMLLLAALGKMAAFPLSFWLPEAMIAPTPVSALLHAATMVAAGPYLLTRMAPLFEYSQVAMVAAIITGGLTLLIAGGMALCARDAKRVLAYSTISQLAIPVIGVAALAGQASYFHLLAHAWFKAPLFLLVGYLAARHAGTAQTATAADSAGEHSSTALRQLRGLARGSTAAMAVLVLAGAALAGVIGTGGYFGKEQILLALLTRGGYTINPGLDITFAQYYPLASRWWTIGAAVLLLSIPLTAAYTARLVGWLGWGGARRGTESVETTGIEDQGPVTTLPVPPVRQMPADVPGLAGVAGAAIVGCIVLGALGHTLGRALAGGEEARWGNPMNVPWLLAADVLLVLVAAAMAFRIARRQAAAGTEPSASGIAALLADGLHLRRFWLGVVGTPGWAAARWAEWNDRSVIERFVDNSGVLGRRLGEGSRWLDIHVVDRLRYWLAEVWWVIRRAHGRFLQTGYIQHYMLIIIISAVALCFVILRPLAQTFGDMMGGL
jgi:NADH-quinone oxidoreductase subunit L